MWVSLLSNWKLIAIGIVLLSVFYGGYHLRTLQYEAGERTALEERLKAIGVGTTKIISFNSDFDKVKLDAKDCAFQPIPAAYIGLLK